MVRLFHLSDLHFGAEDRAALAAVAACIAAEQPDLVVITGDLTMRARAREYAAARDWITALGVPVAVEPGNHDLPYVNLVERFADPYRRYRRLIQATGQCRRIGDVALLSLWTTARAQWRLNWSKGTVARPRLAAALAELDALPPGVIPLVLCHHPLVETLDERRGHGSALTRGGTRALAELARRKVAAVLSGHVHDAFDRAWPTANGPVRLIGAGTLSERLRHTPPGFNELVVQAGAVQVIQRVLRPQHSPK